MINWTEGKAHRATIFNTDILIFEESARYYLMSVEQQIHFPLTSYTMELAKIEAARILAGRAAESIRDQQRLYEAACKELDGPARDPINHDGDNCCKGVKELGITLGYSTILPKRGKND